MPSAKPTDDDEIPFAVRIQSLKTEDLLNVWEQSQKFSLVVQHSVLRSLLPAEQIHSATEEIIIAELLRRETLRRQKPGPAAPPGPPSEPDRRENS